MNRVNSSNAFVCSSLPIGVLNQNIIEWNIHFILLNNAQHFENFQTLINQKKYFNR